LFSSNLEIDEIELKNGKIQVAIDDDKTKPDIDWKKVDIKELFEKYSSIYSKLPIKINLLKLSAIDSQINDFRFYAKNVAILPHKKEIRIRLDVKKLSVEKPALNLEKVIALISINQNEINIVKLNISDNNNTIDLNAVLVSPKHQLEGKVDGNFQLMLEEMPRYLKGSIKELNELKGKLTGEFKSTGSVFDPNIKVSLLGNSFKSSWVNLEFFKVNFHKNKHIISASNFEAKNNSEHYKSQVLVPVYDLKRNVFIPSKTSVELTDAETNTFLFTVRDSLDVLKGKVSGNVNVIWDGSIVKFEIGPNTIFKDFKLKTPGSNKDILENKGFSLESGDVRLEKDNSVSLNLNIKMKNTLLHAVGKIFKDHILIEIQNGTIDLDSFGPISGVKLTGQGPIDMKIHGPMNDVQFDINVLWKDFSVVDLHFGEVSSHFIFSLKDLNLLIPSMEGHFNKSEYSASGQLGFGEVSKMNLNFNFKETTFKDTQQMYSLVFKKLKGIPDTDLKFESNFNITGGFELPQMLIKGKIKGREFKIFNEEADLVSFNFSLANSNLSFENIKIIKSRGEVHGNFKVNLNSDYMELKGEGKGVRLSDFNHYLQSGLDYDSDLNFDFAGSGTASSFPTQIKIKTINPYIDNIVASQSTAIINFANNEIATTLNILSGKIKAEIILGMESKQASIKAMVDADDIRELLGVVSSHNVIDKTLTGKIKATLQSEFNLVTNKLSKLLVEINKFQLKKGDVDLKVIPGKNIANIENSIVKRWDLKFVDGEDFFSSTGETSAKGGVILKQNFSIKTSIFQIISRYVDKASGKITGNYQMTLGEKFSLENFRLFGKNNSIKFKKMPGIINSLEYEIIKDKSNFVFKKVTGQYGEGEFKITGNALFEDVFPQVNLEYKIERSTIPLFKRSNVLLSGNGSLQGLKPPYKLNGKFQLLHGEFLDDPSEYSGENKISLEEYKKYLPEKNKDEARGIIDLNLSVETTTTPVIIKNNMAEIFIKGTSQMLGNPLDPEISGRIDALPTVSKFKFKGHEFIINQGFVELKNSGKMRNSDLKFIGISKINDYDMKIDISGKIDKLVINLSSEPVLSQEDLLSLLTLGVTSDMSKNLEANERKFVQTVGIGTLLVDQLKINEDLNSSLGLKLSVMPEFKEEVTSLVQGGKSAVSDTTSSKLKSSTKIKINKQITKQIDVSLSSTVGGSLEQKQEVNVNYNFNKSLSLDGVYEVKPAEDSTTGTSTPNSIGADIKYRWSF
jgi:translocation and assembly module TamB